MATVTRCTCCDLPVESCGKAVEQRRREEERIARQRLLAQPGWFMGTYTGRCAWCNEWFSPGDPIKRCAEGYRCGNCA